MTTNETNEKTIKNELPKLKRPKLPYTPLTKEDVGEVMGMAIDELINDPDVADDVSDRYEIEEAEDRPGTVFVNYHAATWWDAYAFQTAVCGAAAARGLFAEESVMWRDGIECRNDGGRRLVSVFLASADYMDETGHAVA